MEIVDEGTHRVLAYIETLNRQGVAPTTAQVNAFANNPRPKTSGSLAALGTLSAELDRIAGSSTESPRDYLSRLGWVSVSNDRIELTKIGKALLKGLNSPSLDSSADVVEIVLDPANPFAYAQALEALGSRGPSMLVEPYFRLKQLMSVAQLNNIGRVLLGTRISKNDEAVLATGLVALPAALRPRLRAAENLHDRYLIPAGDESVLMLGASLGGIGKKVSTVTTLGEVASKALRDAHERLWDRATAIEPSSTSGTVDEQEPSGG